MVALRRERKQRATQKNKKPQVLQPGVHIVRKFNVPQSLSSSGAGNNGGEHGMPESEAKDRRAMDHVFSGMKRFE